jgi:uncharacterized protein
VTESTDATAALVAFARVLRDRGLRVSPAQVTLFQAAVGALPGGELDGLYWAGRACLGVPREFGPAYDAAFAEYFLGTTGPAPPESLPAADTRRGDGQDRQPGQSAQRGALDVAVGDGDDEESSAPAEETGAVASGVERLRVTPFAECSPEELRAVTQLVRNLRIRPPAVAARRLAPGRHHDAMDLRGTAKLAMRTHADLILPAWRQHQRRPRRIVLLLDVSRSMAVYSRLLLQFGYAVVSAGREAEVVCFGTRLTRVTPFLRSRRSAQALEVAAMAVMDWNGGTRIADAVGGLRDLRTVRGALRGAVVVICSDGLEQGDPSDLGTQMAGLRRMCHEIIWVNPLAGDPRYRPISGGMQAALPFIDRLVAGDTVAAIESVAAMLANPGPAGRRTRYPPGRPRPGARVPG